MRIGRRRRKLRRKKQKVKNDKNIFEWIIEWVEKIGGLSHWWLRLESFRFCEDKSLFVNPCISLSFLISKQTGKSCHGDF